MGHHFIRRFANVLAVHSRAAKFALVSVYVETWVMPVFNLNGIIQAKVGQVRACLNCVLKKQRLHAA